MLLANLLPIRGLSNLTNVVNAVVRAATTYLDETISSYSLARGDDNRLRSARDGLLVRGHAIDPERDGRLQGLRTGFEQLTRQAGEALLIAARQASARGAGRCALSAWPQALS